MIVTSTGGPSGKGWRPRVQARVVAGFAQEKKPPEHEAGSAACNLIDCWLYPLLGVAAGVAVAVVGAVVARRVMDRGGAG